MLVVFNTTQTRLSLRGGKARANGAGGKLRCVELDTGAGQFSAASAAKPSVLASIAEDAMHESGAVVTSTAKCDNTCQYSRGGLCDDARTSGYCALGADCQDCGPAGECNFTHHKDDGWRDDDENWPNDDEYPEGHGNTQLGGDLRAFRGSLLVIIVFSWIVDGVYCTYFSVDHASGFCTLVRVRKVMKIMFPIVLIFLTWIKRYTACMKFGFIYTPKYEHLKFFVAAWMFISNFHTMHIQTNFGKKLG